MLGKVKSHLLIIGADLPKLNDAKLCSVYGIKRHLWVDEICEDFLLYILETSALERWSSFNPCHNTWLLFNSFRLFLFKWQIFMATKWHSIWFTSQRGRDFKSGNREKCSKILLGWSISLPSSVANFSWKYSLKSLTYRAKVVCCPIP